MSMMVNGIDPARAAIAEDFFAQHLRAVALPLLPRLDSELLDDAFNHADSAVRENAIFEYVYRHDHDAFAVVLDMYQAEQNLALRTSLFEELSYLDRPAFQYFLERAGVDPAMEHLALAQFDRPLANAQAVRTDPNEIFDQTLPLRISLREYVEVEPGVWKYHVFAPIQEERVAGKLHACSVVETRNRRIVLSKQLQDLHADGSLHIENTLFVGRTVQVAPNTNAFSYQTVMPVPFYPSGRIGDQTEGMIPDSKTFVMRAGELCLSTDVFVRGIPVVQNVTGIIRAWGYTRPDRATFDPAGRMDMVAGLFHLGSLIDDRTRDYVNTYTIGTYRGVLSDTDGDGLLDLNTHPSYATLDGEIDRNRDGHAETPGEHYDTCPAIFPPEHYTNPAGNGPGGDPGGGPGGPGGNPGAGT